MIWILLILAIGLQIGDWYTTKTVISQGGREANPIMIWLIEKMGFNLAFIFKEILISLMGLSLILCLHSRSIIALLLIDILYAWVVYHNWKLIK